MRFNELIAGVREDLAVKIFGEDFEPMLRAAGQNRHHPCAASKAPRTSRSSRWPACRSWKSRSTRARSRAAGLSLATCRTSSAPRSAGRAAGLVFEGDRRFQIIVRLPDAVRNECRDAGKFAGDAAASRRRAAIADHPIALRLATFNFSEGPNQISRENGKRRVVVTAEVRGRDIGSLVAEAQAKVAEQVSLPAGYWLAWGGQFENFEAARQRLLIVVPACFALIFLLLLSALGSARDALLVFSAVPLAFTGGIVALWLRGMPFSVSAAVGFIALSGVAVLNGLVMLSFIRQLMEQGAARSEAIQGARSRACARS